jgi:hypothetical protein
VDIEQPSPSLYGVARPCAVSGFHGTDRVQFCDAVAWSADWLRLMAAPVPSTGLVATSPSCVVAIGPAAKSLGVTGILGAACTAAVCVGQGVAGALGSDA